MHEATDDSNPRAEISGEIEEYLQQRLFTNVFGGHGSLYNSRQKQEWFFLYSVQCSTPQYSAVQYSTA